MKTCKIIPMLIVFLFFGIVVSPCHAVIMEITSGAKGFVEVDQDYFWVFSDIKISFDIQGLQPISILPLFLTEIKMVYPDHALFYFDTSGYPDQYGREFAVGDGIVHYTSGQYIPPVSAVGGVYGVNIQSVELDLRVILNSSWTDYNIIAEVRSVPEPSALFLLGAGLAGLGVFRRKFKKASSRITLRGWHRQLVAGVRSTRGLPEAS